MSNLRTGRQKYYNIFSHFYDLFIKVHSHNYGEETRKFLVDSAQLDKKTHPRVLAETIHKNAVLYPDAVNGAKRFPGVRQTGYCPI
jgi:ferritin-like protein